ncbi:MAG TPA: hypothetical protein VNJ71_11075 [Gemmatimonadales bacterium]|jgi:hypothetical protein|nr:hypothetical protein [Gemmatimonadales bacterium]
MLVTPAIAGEAIAVVPLTLVVWEQGIEGLADLGDHARALAWADSSVGVALQLRAPEVKWILPPELRKIARRAPGVAPDPDRMGQAVMRAQNLKDVPDPLRGHLRSLAALTGGRFALVPASLGFLKDPSGGIRAELALVLADTRTGKVAWRSLAWGVGATPARALAAALASVLPADLGAAQ